MARARGLLNGIERSVRSAKDLQGPAPKNCQRVVLAAPAVWVASGGSASHPPNTTVLETSTQGGTHIQGATRLFC